MDSSFKLGDVVRIVGKKITGKIAFCGQTHFTNGCLYGIILELPKGKHNGRIGGVTYFQCKKNHGLFTRACQLVKDEVQPPRLKQPRVCTSRPLYPNYLKHSSKMLFKRPKGINDKYYDDERYARERKTPPDLTATTSTVEAEQADFTDFGSIEEERRTLIEQLSRKNELLAEATKRLMLSSVESKELTSELTHRKAQVTTAKRHVEKLKTYLRWIKKCESSRSDRSKRITKVVSQFVDFFVQKLSDTLNREYAPDSSEDGNPEEQDVVLQKVNVLEEQNGMLIELLLDVWKLLNAERGPLKAPKDADKSREAEKVVKQHGDGVDVVPESSPEPMSLPLEMGKIDGVLEHTESDTDSGYGREVNFRLEKQKRKESKAAALANYLNGSKSTVGDDHSKSALTPEAETPSESAPAPQPNSSGRQFGLSKSSLKSTTKELQDLISQIISNVNNVDGAKSIPEKDAGSPSSPKKPEQTIEKYAELVKSLDGDPQLEEKTLDASSTIKIGQSEKCPSVQSAKGPRSAPSETVDKESPDEDPIEDGECTPGDVEDFEKMHQLESAARGYFGVLTGTMRKKRNSRLGIYPQFSKRKNSSPAKKSQQWKI